VVREAASVSRGDALQVALGNGTMQVTVEESNAND
jgi:hypothetical protein